jgi:hypothetical protein
MSLRDRILSAKDIQSQSLEVPEWGLTVEVRGMSGADRARIIEAAMTTDGGVNLQAFYPDVVISCCHDPETGERVFDPEDRIALMEKSGKAIDRIASLGLELSGMTEDAQKATGKGSSTTPKGVSSTS